VSNVTSFCYQYQHDTEVDAGVDDEETNALQPHQTSLVQLVLTHTGFGQQFPYTGPKNCNIA